MFKLFSRKSMPAKVTPIVAASSRSARISIHMSWPIPRPGAAPSSIRCSTTTRSPAPSHPLRRCHPQAHRRERLQAGVDPRHASARRPFLGCGLSQGQDWRPHGDGRQGRRGAAAMEGHLQPGRGFSRRRLPVGPAVRRRRDLQDRQLPVEVMHCPGHTLASDHLRRRRCRLHPRHPVHAGRRHSKGRFPRRQRAGVVAQHPAHPGLPDETRLFTGHDYKPNGRPPAWESTVAQQKRRTPTC